MGLFKVIISLALGVVIFLGVLSYLTTDSLRSHFLSEDFYSKHFSENDVYNRLYDAVLVPEVTRQIQQDDRANFLGGIRIEEEDVEPLIKGILSPPQLRRQVEGAVSGAVEYLNEEIDPATDEPIAVPDVYIYFRPIIGTGVPTPEGVEPVEGTAKPALVRFLAKAVENNLVILPPPEGTLQDRVETFSLQLADTLIQLEDPQFPVTAPSLVGVPPELRPAAYAQAKVEAREKGFSLDLLALLDQFDEEVNEALLLPDSREALTRVLVIAVEPLAGPLIDSALEEFRENQLDDQDRFDPLRKIAKNRGVSKGEVLADVEQVREWLTRGKTAGSWGGILAIVVFSVLLGLVHLPGLKSFMGWPGLAILLSGGAFLGIALALRAQLPNMFASFLEVGHAGCDGLAGRASDVEPALCQLGIDVGTSMLTDVTGSLIVPTIVIMMIGGALVIASLLKRSPAK